MAWAYQRPGHRSATGALGTVHLQHTYWKDIHHCSSLTTSGVAQLVEGRTGSVEDEVEKAPPMSLTRPPLRVACVQLHLLVNSAVMYVGAYLLISVHPSTPALWAM